MRDKAQSGFAIGMGWFLIVLGGVLNVWMFLAGGWPTFVFFIVMAVGLVFVALGYWSRRNWVFRNRPAGWIKRHIGWITAGTLVTLIVISQIAVNVTTEESFEMIWRYEPFPQRPDLRHIILTFADFPNYYVGIYSSDLGQYLERLPSGRVKVVFAVTRDLGDVRGYQEVQIGDLRSWNASGGHGGRTGNYRPGEPTPWRNRLTLDLPFVQPFSVW
jgi:hypothetical protein